MNPLFLTSSPLALCLHRDCVEYFDVGTPVTNRYYIRANKCEMYGLDHNKERFTAEATNELRAETDIKNLYLCGHDIFNCGIAGAAFGGLLCASKTEVVVS